MLEHKGKRFSSLIYQGQKLRSLHGGGGCLWRNGRLPQMPPGEMVLVTRCDHANLGIYLAPMDDVGVDVGDAMLDWGDGSPPVHVHAGCDLMDLGHVYAREAEWRIKITGYVRWGEAKYYTYQNNIGVTSIELPTGISPIVRYQYPAFNGWEQLRNIPAQLLDRVPTSTSFSDIFLNCKSVTGLLPELWNKFPTSYHERCFRDCTKASNYAEAKAAGWA